MAKKCNPFECKLFNKNYKRIYDKFPADVLVTECSYRIGKGVECTFDD
jgi:hypothetical protein